MSLPEPSSEDLRISSLLKKRIMDEIIQNDGWISFARFMELALYEPGLGYYSNNRVKIGQGGDFITAPEISSLFGKTLARVLIDFLGQTESRILEFGAGTGQLAFDILSECRRVGFRLDVYEIVDLSGDLRQEQESLLAGFHEVRWLDQLPETYSGVIIGNEVLDAMPVQLVTKKNGEWFEQGVSLENEQFTSQVRPCSEKLSRQITWQIPDAALLPDSYVTEVHTHAMAFLRSVVGMIQAEKRSVCLFIDYGFPAHEYYMPERNQGTLLSHYRHRVHADPYFAVGSQDITSHLDFSALIRTVIESGNELLCYANQADLLLASGITERLLDISPQNAEQYLPEARRMQTLISPNEMGELFKVLIFGDLSLPDYLLSIDRSERL